MTVIPFPEPEDYWESCPKCHRYDVFLNVRKENWVVCHRHKTKWCIGYNLFSGWLYQTEKDWERNRALLATYQLVEPWVPPRACDGYGQETTS